MKKYITLLFSFVFILPCILILGGCNLHTCYFNEWGHCTVCSNSICKTLTEVDNMVYETNLEHFKTNENYYYKFVANAEHALTFKLDTESNVRFDRIELFTENDYVMALKIASRYSDTEYRLETKLVEGKTYHLKINYFGEGDGKLTVYGHLLPLWAD